MILTTSGGQPAALNGNQHRRGFKMKTKAHLPDGSSVTIKSVLETVTCARRGYTQKINKVLEKYNEDWIGNESDIDMSVLSDVDDQLYNTLFEARQLIRQIESNLSVLAHD
ncbi:MAG: hypothetical protein ACRDD9_18115 [Shewanella sp.]